MRESSPRVSVAMCTHNGEQFVDAQVASILAQTRMPVEIVVSDDASADRTVARIRDVVARHASAHPDASPALRVLENPRPLGVTANFEQAILACGSEFVALCDQDDVWHPDRLELALGVFDSRSSLQLVHGNARLVDQDGAGLPGSLFEALGVDGAALLSIHTGGAFDLLMRRNLVTGATTMIRRELAEFAAPFPVGWVHDEWLAIVAAAFDRIDVVEEQLIDYRQHGANQIGVRALSTAETLGRMLEPGLERNRRLLVRAQSLVQRFTAMGESIPADRLGAARAKLAHELARAALPTARARRLPRVIRELRTGRYGDFGRGAADAVRDLIQPLRPLG